MALNFIKKYDMYFVFIGIILAFIGFTLSITAGVMNERLYTLEKELRISSSDAETAQLRELLDKKIQASSFAYTGIIFVALGFIFNIVIHSIVRYKNNRLRPRSLGPF
jgi:hypothetical protein